LKITISVSKYKLLVWFETDATKLPRQHHTQSERVLLTPKNKQKQDLQTILQSVMCKKSTIGCSVSRKPVATRNNFASNNNRWSTIWCRCV
jgi:hypothetical protein